MRIGRLRADRASAAIDAGALLPLALDCSRRDRDQMLEHVRARSRRDSRDREQVLVALRVDERDLRARAAPPCECDARSAALPCADSSRRPAREFACSSSAIEQPSAGIQRIARFVAEIRATQTMIEIRAAEAARDAAPADTALRASSSAKQCAPICAPPCCFAMRPSRSATSASAVSQSISCHTPFSRTSGFSRRSSL